MNEDEDFLTLKKAKSRSDDEELLESIRHLFITGGDTMSGNNNMPSIERRRTKLTVYRRSQKGKRHQPRRIPRHSLAAKKEALKRKFDEQYGDPDPGAILSLATKDEKCKREHG